MFSIFSLLFLPLPLSFNTPTNTAPTHLFVVHFELPVFAGVRFAVTGRDGGNKNERKQGNKEQRKNDRVRGSGYSLMLSEWSVKTRLKCSSVMKD